MTQPSTAASTVALDVGQSGSRLAVDGRRVNRPMPGLRGDLPINEQLAELVARASEVASKSVATVAIGSTGVESLTIASELRQRLSGAVTSVLVAHDSVTSYLGSRGIRPGCVLAVGTGTVALAVGTDVARVDGWGSLVGDAGSGYWIGRAAIEAVLRAEDGRGPATALRRRVANRYDGLHQLGIRLQAEADRVRLIAMCARDVAAVAATDSVAAEITGIAGRELAVTVQTAVERAGLGADATVIAIGNALLSEPLRIAFNRHLAELLPNVRREEPAGDGLDGAGLLPSVPPEFPLHGLISWT